MYLCTTSCLRAINVRKSMGIYGAFRLFGPQEVAGLEVVLEMPVLKGLELQTKPPTIDRPWVHP